MEDWFVQEIYTGEFPLVPEAVKGHLVRPVFQTWSKAGVKQWL